MAYLSQVFLLPPAKRQPLLPQRICAQFAQALLAISLESVQLS